MATSARKKAKHIPLMPVPATIVADKPLISHNSWTDRAGKPVKTSLEWEIEWEWQKHTFAFEIFEKNSYLCFCRTEISAKTGVNAKKRTPHAA